MGTTSDAEVSTFRTSHWANMWRLHDAPTEVLAAMIGAVITGPLADTPEWQHTAERLDVGMRHRRGLEHLGRQASLQDVDLHRIRAGFVEQHGQDWHASDDPIVREVARVVTQGLQALDPSTPPDQG